jgi:atypical dual specificity phosphatase
MLRNFRYIIPDQLAGMAHPGWRDRLPAALAELRECGITTVVSLDEEGLADDILAEHGFEYRHYPVDDFCAPTIEQAEDFCRFVDEQLAKGSAVAVHCWAGVGRTGTMLACYLIHRGDSVGEAISKVREKGGLETPEQEEFLYEFEAVDRRRDQKNLEDET